MRTCQLSGRATMFDDARQEKCFETVWAAVPETVAGRCQGYDELYGYKLVNNGPSEHYDEKVARALIGKLCKAYQFEEAKVLESLARILNWRREFNPLSAAYKESHAEVLNKVGILTNYPKGEANKKVVTWNLYGQIVKEKQVFKDADLFIRYRIGLMERGLRLMDFTNEDNCYMTQVHDYKGVSVFRMDSEIKKCTKQTIAIFQSYYPELLNAKYFVNVPTLFSLTYDFVKKFIDPETSKKFVVLNDGRKLGQYLKECPSKDYGGSDKAKSLQQQNMKTPQPTKYSLYLLEQQANLDID